MTIAVPLRIFALGRIRVLRDERELTSHDWTYAKSRELLVFLASHTPRTKEQIGLALWPDASESQLRNNFRVTLFHARRSLGNPNWIRFEGDVYAFNRALQFEFDVETFEQKVTEAGRIKLSNPARAAALLQEAAQLYQGDFCEDLTDGDWHHLRQAALQRSFLEALLVLGQLLFTARRFADAASVYRKAIDKDSYREPAHRGLMRSLSQMGETGQALEHYRALATLLRNELNQKPEPETTALYERLQSGVEKTTPDSSAPFQAPIRLTRFVGREPELDAMRKALAPASTRTDKAVDLAAVPPANDPAASNVFGLVGMGGIGKTTLAVTLAHRLRDQFPDGVLWAHVATSEPMAVLDSWARAYQCDYSALPDLESRAAAMRSLLADKRVLLILDDVANAERARPLLLGGALCRVLVTSRNREATAALDARLIDVPPLEPLEGRQLLARILGAARVDAEAEEAAEICALLGQLPLAIEIAAKRLLLNPRWRFADMATKLRDQFARLDELRVGDKAVRATFAVSWDLLTDPLRRLFTHLAVFAGRPLTASALAAVAQTDRHSAADGLDALVSLSLLSPHDTVHYAQHPLLTDFAREKLGVADEAFARMASYYLGFATEHQSDYLALEEEWENLSAGMQVAHTRQRWQNVIDYATALTPAWFARGRFSDARKAYPLAAEAATAEEDQDAYIASTLKWGQACIEQGDYAEADKHLQRALQVARDVDDKRGIAHADFLLARVARETSQHDRARQLLLESQRIRSDLNDMGGVAESLYLQARIRHDFDDEIGAEALARQALAIQQTLPADHARIVTLRLLGVITSLLGNLTQAEQYIQQALDLCGELQDRGELSIALYDMSTVLRRQGKFEIAREHALQGLVMLRRSGDRKVEAFVLHQLSFISFALKEYDAALVEALRGLSVLKELGDIRATASILQHIGDVYAQMARFLEACASWSEALALAEKLQHPLTKTLRDRLERLCGQP